MILSRNDLNKSKSNKKIRSKYFFERKLSKYGFAKEYTKHLMYCGENSSVYWLVYVYGGLVLCCLGERYKRSY